MAGSQALLPVVIRREGADQLVIDWNDGVRTFYTWPHLRDNCPCASCREEKTQPPDPFRLLKPNELVPLAPVAIEPVGRYAYRITWSDGHDTGIYTLENLRALALRAEPTPESRQGDKETRRQGDQQQM